MKRLLIFFTIVSVLIPLFFVNAAVTKITKFEPAGAKVGEQITITGENLLGVTNVIFSKEVKTTTTTTTATSITVKVPENAVTGPITLRGTGSDIVSTIIFTVPGTTGIGTGNPNTPPPAVNPQTNTGPITFSGLVPVCNTGDIDAKTGNYKNACNFDMIIAMINHDIDYFTIFLVTPLFALIIIYTAYLYLSSSASPDNIKKAKKIFANAIFGYLIVLVAWLVIKAVLVGLGFNGPMFLA